MPDPFFSIIMPTYNRGGLIKETIESVLKQEYRDFELLIIDDGSTDNTRQIVTSINDQRIFYIYQENKERGAARNKGVSLAKGNYITFFDSDDIVYPNHLAEAYKFIQQESALLFVNSYQLVNSEGKIIQTIDSISAPTPYLQLAYNNTLSIVLFFKNELARKVRFSEDRNFIIGEDLFYLLKAGLLAELKHNPVITFGVRVHQNRTMASVQASKMIISLFTFLAELKSVPEITEKLGTKAVKKLKAVMISNCAIYAASFRKYKIISVSLLLRSLIYNPLILAEKKIVVYSRSFIFKWLPG